ncbi:MAG: YabP/YqfC family sporulation protein [Bacilli bacterium]|nr:YabP/YqfC family sporulation protein [Bacilli bacterium]
MLRDLRNYILEKDFRINYVKNKLNIVNYVAIDHFSDNKVIARYDGGTFIIKGENLIISKLLEDEVLISGIIKNIEINDRIIKK